MESFILTITEKHLIKAEQESLSREKGIINCRCVIAQAAKERFKDKFISMGNSICTLTGASFICLEAFQITNYSYTDQLQDGTTRKHLINKFPIKLKFIK